MLIKKHNADDYDNDPCLNRHQDAMHTLL